MEWRADRHPLSSHPELIPFHLLPKSGCIKNQRLIPSKIPAAHRREKRVPPVQLSSRRGFRKLLPANSGTHKGHFRMTERYLNLATRVFDENHIGGLMICGINWGGPEDSTPLTKDEFGESFFSDARFADGPSPYRRNVVRWFFLLGHPLAGSEKGAGPFERSIVQTNWLPDQSPNMSGRATRLELVGEWGNFQFHLERLKPKLLMFMGVQLLEALNSPECLAGTVHIFGPAAHAPRWETRPIRTNVEEKEGVAVGFQRFERLQVIAFPHPSWPRSDDYIASFHDAVSPLIAAYKAERGFKP